MERAVSMFDVGNFPPNTPPPGWMSVFGKRGASIRPATQQRAPTSGRG